MKPNGLNKSFRLSKSYPSIKDGLEQTIRNAGDSVLSFKFKNYVGPSSLGKISYNVKYRRLFIAGTRFQLKSNINNRQSDYELHILAAVWIIS